jgi:putative ABC transport system substrate-binding protein
MRLIVLMLVLGFTFAPLAVHAQPAGRQVKIGVLCAGACPFGGGEGAIRPLIDALERVGLVRGRTLVLDIGGVVTSEDQVVGEAQKLVSRRPDLILVWTGSVAAARAAKDATHTIPIVLMAVPDVVEHGLVDSLARPGGNITGTSIPVYDLTIKQLQVLKEISPRLQRIVVVQGDLSHGDRHMVDRLRGAADSLRLQGGLATTDVPNLEQALAAAPAGASAVLAIGSMPHVVQARIQRLALERKLPLVFPWKAWFGGGSHGLVAYGPRFTAIAERTASLSDRIIKGTRPADLPVEQPTSYELIIDGVMSKALGLTIPQSVLLRADQVIE